MSSDRKNSKRIAKNTLLLYFRMILMMGISLYTSRIVLNALGIEDFGIYNVVGGFVSLFTVFNASLMVAISRFITFELGAGNIDTQRKIFSTSVNIEIAMSVVIGILAETVGLWFLNTQMVIPSSRLFAANIVYQLSLLTFIINLISIPYNAAIVAHEKMSAFAYISLLEAGWKLMVAYSVYITFYDKLITYGILLALIAIVVRLIYGWYCKKNFVECSYYWGIDKIIFKRMLSFAGWEMIGSTAVAVNGQGGNVLINMFAGPSVNAARGVAMQVYGAINGFVSNFMMALNPQITKAYAQGDFEYMWKLVFVGARFSFYLMMVISLPILINTHYILELWLKVVPDYSVTFLRLTLITAILNTLSQPLATTQNATGKNKLYQIFIGGINLLNLPIAYICLKMGASVVWVFGVTLGIDFIRTFMRLPILNRMINLNMIGFLTSVIGKCFLVAFLSCILPYYVYNSMSESLVNFIVTTTICVISSGIMCFFVGMTKMERLHIINKLKKNME